VFNFSGSEIFFLLILGLVILGPEKLPGVIRKAGKLYGEFKRITTDAQSEFKGAFGDTIGDLRETAQGYKSMFDSASQEANNTLRDVAQFDHNAPNLPDAEPEIEPEPTFIPFEVGFNDLESDEDEVTPNIHDGALEELIEPTLVQLEIEPVHNRPEDILHSQVVPEPDPELDPDSAFIPFEIGLPETGHEEGN